MTIQCRVMARSTLYCKDSFVLLNHTTMLSLSNILKVNAVSSGATGLLLALFPDIAGAIFDVNTTAPFTETGIFLIVFALFVFIVNIGKPIKLKSVKTIVLLDTLWVISSALVLLVVVPAISTWGSIIIAGVAIWVALMAYLQHTASKNYKNNYASPGLV